MLMLSTNLHAQSESSVIGRVVTPGDSLPIAAPSVMVTLHRVGSDSSGPIDSVRSDAAGRYAFRYRRFGAPEAVYFAAAVYRGIAYFGAPLRAARSEGEAAEITVFDTTSRHVDFHVPGHHVVVSSPRPDGTREVVEVWELANDTTVTVIGRDTLTPVWTAWLPPQAANLVGGQGDVSAGTIAARNGRVAVFAPFGPGVKQVSYSYTLPASSFPLTIPVELATQVLEVLVEEAGAQVAGAGLKAVAPATTQGRTFNRFLGQDAPGGQSIRLNVPTSTAATRATTRALLAGVIALAMIGALVRALTRRGASRRAPAHTLQPTDALVAAIADLDAQRERGDASIDDARYASERAALKAQLAAALAAQQSAQ